MPYNSEREMYAVVVAWLEGFLRNKFPKSRVIVADTSRMALNDFIARENLSSYFPPEWVTFDLHVDITGIIISKEHAQLAFIECKLSALTLSNVSQLLGYSRIASPLLSLLISPAGVSDSVISLIKTYARTDTLEYYWEKGKPARTLILAQWNERAQQIEPSSLLPSNALSLFGSNLSRSIILSN